MDDRSRTFVKLERVAERLGSRASLAFALGTSESALKSWFFRQEVPTPYHAVILTLWPDEFKAPDFIDDLATLRRRFDAVQMLARKEKSCKRQ